MSKSLSCNRFTSSIRSRCARSRIRQRFGPICFRRGPISFAGQTDIGMSGNRTATFAPPHGQMRDQFAYRVQAIDAARCQFRSNSVQSFLQRRPVPCDSLIRAAELIRYSIYFTHFFAPVTLKLSLL